MSEITNKKQLSLLENIKIFFNKIKRKELVFELLDVASSELEEANFLTQRLLSENSGLFSQPLLKEATDLIAEAYEKARERLNNPTLFIATIGTTSSGKSTLVNALIGRKIAPIESKEMSGGVLILRHSLTKSLEIQNTQNSVWESGLWNEISDSNAYLKCKKVMKSYHRVRKDEKTTEILPPKIIFKAPLLPGVDSSLLDPPIELGIEFIDLPGLKSIQDMTNLSVIKAQVHSAVNLVVLDYNQTDETKRKKLLEELQRTVEVLNGRSDSMLFVLNRVDQRGKDDDLLEDRVELLRDEIKKILSLQKRPKIISFNARLLYNAQCACGPTQNEDPPSSQEEEQLNYLASLFEDCASSMKRLKKANPDFQKKLHEIESEIEDEKLPSEEDLRLILDLTRDWSGGMKLWTHLREQLESSFAELVILTSLREYFETHRGLLKILRVRYKRDLQGLHSSLNDLELSLARLNEAARAKIVYRDFSFLEWTTLLFATMKSSHSSRRLLK